MTCHVQIGPAPHIKSYTNSIKIKTAKTKIHVKASPPFFYQIIEKY